MNKEIYSTKISPKNLGFAAPIEPSEKWQLESRYFPSKLGGKPAWLNLKDLPTVTEMLCPTCSLPRSFLCQIYANIDNLPTCFHRTLFVFMCRSPKVGTMKSGK